MADCIRRLEARLSHVLGGRVWPESGFGASAGIDMLKRRNTELEQKVVHVTRERGEELDAVRAASLKMITWLNAGPRTTRLAARTMIRRPPAAGAAWPDSLGVTVAVVISAAWGNGLPDAAAAASLTAARHRAAYLERRER